MEVQVFHRFRQSYCQEGRPRFTCTAKKINVAKNDVLQLVRTRYNGLIYSDMLLLSHGFICDYIILSSSESSP